MRQHFIQRDWQRGVVAVHHHGGAVAHQNDVNVRGVDLNGRQKTLKVVTTRRALTCERRKAQTYRDAPCYGHLVEALVSSCTAALVQSIARHIHQSMAVRTHAQQGNQQQNI